MSCLELRGTFGQLTCESVRLFHFLPFSAGVLLPVNVRFLNSDNLGNRHSAGICKDTTPSLRSQGSPQQQQRDSTALGRPRGRGQAPCHLKPRRYMRLGPQSMPSEHGVFRLQGLKWAAASQVSSRADRGGRCSRPSTYGSVCSEMKREGGPGQTRTPQCAGGSGPHQGGGRGLGVQPPTRRKRRKGVPADMGRTAHNTLDWRASRLHGPQVRPDTNTAVGSARHQPVTERRARKDLSKDRTWEQGGWRSRPQRDQATSPKPTSEAVGNPVHLHTEAHGPSSGPPLARRPVSAPTGSVSATAK